MNIDIQAEISRLSKLGILQILLEDKTSNCGITWATDAYQDLGAGYQRDEQITSELVTNVVKHRANKDIELQSDRTRLHAEVFTPLWVCNKMLNYADEEWFGIANNFNVDSVPTKKVKFPRGKRWKSYVGSNRLEIACGEAPFLVSRYDVATGEFVPLANRIGILDRKIRVVNEKTKTEEEWLEWVTRAFQSTYGYELQGDNVLIARINLIMSFEEYLNDRWQRKPTLEEYKKISEIIVWNVWQMDGLTKKRPNSEKATDLFNDESETDDKQITCKIFDWRDKTSLRFSEVIAWRNSKMKFDFIIGNPPYQEEVEDNGRQSPIYHLFMEEAYKISNVVEFITPARFLFNAGQTPKSWNEKMLQDPHFKILFYEQDSGAVFAGKDIKGGVVISYRNNKETYGAIETYSHFAELNSIRKKVDYSKSIADIVTGAVPYQFSTKLKKEHPEYVDLAGKSFDLRTNVLDKLQDKLFFDEPIVGEKCIQIFGLYQRKRSYKWVASKYVVAPSNFKSYKVFLPKSNGSGAIGEVLTNPLIGLPQIGHTQSFISLGNFKTEAEANALLKYVKSKFARALLGILKVTQDNSKAVWKYVPLQDFTSASDIDWTKSIPEIDQQLYKKYKLSNSEIAFIESHVQEMK